MTTPKVWKVWPEPRRSDLYFKVFVSADKPGMYLLEDLIAERQGISGCTHNYLARARAYKHRDKRLKNQMGHLAFFEGSARRTGVVAHELLHAAVFYWTTRLGRRMAEIGSKKNGNTNAAHERFAHIVTELTRQYWLGWWKHIEDPALRSYHPADVESRRLARQRRQAAHPLRKRKTT